MNINQSRKYKVLDYVQRAFEILQYLIVAFAVFYVIRQTVERANGAQDSAAKLNIYLTGAVLIFFIILFFAAIYLGFKWAEKLGDYVQNELYIFPRWRRAIIAPMVVVSPGVIYWALGRMETEITIKVIVGLYFFILVNASVLSFIREDRFKEKSPLTKYISRDSYLQDRQAALVKAFIVVEDHLSDKVGESNKFSKSLIDEAYKGNQSKLRLVVDGKDRTSDFRDFLAGAYGMLRNPRHHSLIEDDLYTSGAIYAVAELLLEYVNASEKRTGDGETGD